MLDCRYNGWGTYEFLLSNQLYASYKLSFKIKTEDEIELLNKFFAEINTDLLRLDSVKLDFPWLSIQNIMHLAQSKKFCILDKFVQQHSKTPLYFNQRIDDLYINSNNGDQFAQDQQNKMIQLLNIEVPYDLELKSNIHFAISENIGILANGTIKFNKLLTWGVPIEWLKFRFPSEMYNSFDNTLEKSTKESASDLRYIKEIIDEQDFFGTYQDLLQVIFNLSPYLQEVTSEF